VDFGKSAVESVVMNPEFWRKRKVLITGHTGFKGSWLSLWLQNLRAEVVGYALPPPTQPSLFDLARIGKGMESLQGDILDLESLGSAIQEHKPEIVFHLAAQSLVRRSYEDPVGTYATNVLGTVHLLQAVRNASSVRSVVVVTSDKCYENRGDQRAYRETDRLGGADPYSNSKAAAELATAAFRESFFSKKGAGVKPGVASARAGNVIGGGDWAADRLIPDVMRAALEDKELLVRNPHAVRPWQHVLDPLNGYLLLAQNLWQHPEEFSESWNFGPDERETKSVAAVLDRVRELWAADIRWRVDDGSHPHEAQYLKLDCTKARTKLGWKPQWNFDSALEATIQWYKAYQSRQELREVAENQIRSYQSARSVPEMSRK
jgi:CDP-glucose 4,6-dehydratase